MSAIHVRRMSLRRMSESTPLLMGPDLVTVDLDSGLAGLDRPASTWTELCVLVRSSVPLCAGLMLETALNTINILVVGRLGPTELAVAGNSSLLATVTGWQLPLALAAAFTTLSAPLYAHTDQRGQISLTLQRTVLLSFVSASFIMAFWWNIAPILHALKQPPEIVEGMKTYMRWMTLVLPGLGLVESMKAFLQVQGIMHPPPLILLCLLPVHTGLAIFLVHFTPVGASGAPIAMALTLGASGLLLVLYVSRTRARECWGDGFDRAALTGWWEILRLAIPGAIMFGSEWWAFEIVSLLAGRLSPAAVAAQAVISTLDQIVAMMPYAISVAIANRVGNLLGLGHGAIKRARMTVRAAFVLELLVSGTFGAIVLFARRHLARIFTDDPDVAVIAAEAAVFVASYQIFDGLQNVGAACLRAFGRQSVGSIIHFVAYYIIGIPLGAFLGLGRPHWGLSGLWAGAATALGFTASSELLFASTIKWESEIERVQQRHSSLDDVDEECEGDYHDDP